MIYTRGTHEFITIIVIILSFSHNICTLISAQEQVTLLKCKNSDPELKDTLEIPKHLMESENTAIFKLANNSEKMNCPEIEYVNITLMTNESLHDPENERGIFTSDGILMAHTEDSFIHYRQVRDYCIQSAGDVLNVSVCEMKCGRVKVDSKPSVKGSTKLRPCIHKCCRNPHEILYFDENREIGCRYPNVSNKMQSLKPFLIEDINKRFSLSQLDSGVTPNYFSNKDFPNCDVSTFLVLQVPKNLYSLKYDKKLNVNVFRLSKNGTIESCAKNQWVELSNDDLCVDALQNFGDEHDASGDLITLMSLRCLHPSPSLISKDSNATMENHSTKPGNMRTTLLYFVSLPIACCFLFVTIVVYLLLWERQNIHGKTVLCYIVSLFLFFLTLCLSQAWPMGSNLCYINAVLGHFCFILTFSWLTAINFDIYWTFRKLQISSKVQNNKQFLLYVVACLTVPCIFIIVGISLDNSYGNTHIPTCTPEDETSNSWIRTPQYGVKSCYISDSAEGWYDYFIGGILLACNVVFFNLTVYRLCQHRKSANAAMKSSSQEDKPVRLFGKLLAVMGAGWIFEFIGWAIKRSSKESSAMWAVYICDCVTLLQAVALFLIFVCKRQIFVQLWQKYDNLRCILSVCTRNGCCDVPPDRKNTLTTTNQTGVSGTLGRSTLNKSNKKPESPESTPLTMTNRSRKVSIENILK